MNGGTGSCNGREPLIRRRILVGGGWCGSEGGIHPCRRDSRLGRSDRGASGSACGVGSVSYQWW